jgi:hypothetical protein
VSSGRKPGNYSVDIAVDEGLAQYVRSFLA